MQPNDPSQQWRQPNPAQTGAPYVAPPVDTPQPTQPIDTPSLAAPPSISPVAPYQDPATPVPTPMPAQQPVTPPAEATPDTPTLESQPETQSSPERSIDVDETQIEESQMETGDTEIDVDELADSDNDSDEPLLRWQAPEYVQHQRPAVWYILLALITIGLTIAAILLIKSYTFAVLVPVMAIALVVYAKRPPAVINYTLSKKGFYVNDKLYPYSIYKSFSVMTHAGHNNLQLIPIKRFQLGNSVYFPDDIGEPLVDMLASRLPMKTDKPDLYDKLISKLKM